MRRILRATAATAAAPVATAVVAAVVVLVAGSNMGTVPYTLLVSVPLLLHLSAGEGLDAFGMHVAALRFVQDLVPSCLCASAHTDVLSWEAHSDIATEVMRDMQEAGNIDTWLLFWSFQPVLMWRCGLGEGK